MSLLWKVLIGLLLTLPVAAYAAGAMVGPSGTVAHRDPVATPTGSAERVGSAAPSPTPPGRDTESGSSDAASLGTGSAGDYEDQEKQVEPGRRGVGNRSANHSPPQRKVRPEKGPKEPAAAPHDSPGGPAADSQDAPDDTTTTETSEDTATTETPEDTTTEAPEDNSGDTGDSDDSEDEGATED